jgi:hypothetical protein
MLYKLLFGNAKIQFKKFSPTKPATIFPKLSVILKYFGIFLIISCTHLALATTYYVSTSGNDSNNGKTTATPWRTLSYAESSATTPGDIILLKKGDVWYLTKPFVIEHSGSNDNYIIWDGGSWGSGSNAIIKQ